MSVINVFITTMLMLFVFTSCEMTENDGHVYLRDKWSHDPNCGKCREINKDKE